MDNPSKVESLDIINGLSPEDHGLLNKAPSMDPSLFEESIEENLRLLDQKRNEYFGDPLALEEIDVYDPRSPYTQKHIEWICALKERDYCKIRKLRRWFLANYPLITGTRKENYL